MPDADEHLDAVTINQLTWKPSVSRGIACRIVDRVVRDEFVWPDELYFDDIATGMDMNCIGIAWRLLLNAEIVEQSGQYRKSTKDGSNSRVIFQYRLKSIARAKTFLTRNGGATASFNQQPEFKF